MLGFLVLKSWVLVADKFSMEFARLYLFIFLFSAGFYPAVSESQVFALSDTYVSGPYLVYDCSRKHWACVSEENFNDCKFQRNEDLEYREKLTHSCSPISLFPSFQSCNQRKLFLTTHNHGQRFCVKEEWRSKNVSF